MTASLPNKVAYRREHTGDVARDRAQALAQNVKTAHEQTKNIVAALINQAYVALDTDVTLNIAAYATLLTTTITTVLPSGHIVITVTATGLKNTAGGTLAIRVKVDGTVAKAAYVTAGAGSAFSVSMVVRVAATAGPHTVIVEAKTSSNGATINAATVAEEHAHMLVQEAL